MFLASAFFFDNFLSFQVLNHDPVEGANNCEMTLFFSFFLIFFWLRFLGAPFCQPRAHWQCLLASQIFHLSTGFGGKFGISSRGIFRAKQPKVWQMTSRLSQLDYSVVTFNTWLAGQSTPHFYWYNRKALQHGGNIAVLPVNTSSFNIDTV